MYFHLEKNNLKKEKHIEDGKEVIEKIETFKGVFGIANINKNITIDGNNRTLNYSTWSNSVFVLEEGINLDEIKGNIKATFTNLNIVLSELGIMSFLNLRMRKGHISTLFRVLLV